MTKEEIEKIKVRIARGKQKIDEVNGWLNPDYKEWTDDYEKLCIKLLHYETENNLLPI